MSSMSLSPRKSKLNPMMVSTEIGLAPVPPKSSIMQDGSLTLKRRGLFNFREMRSEKGKQSMPPLTHSQAYNTGADKMMSWNSKRALNSMSNYDRRREDESGAVYGRESINNRRLRADLKRRDAQMAKDYYKMVNWMRKERIGAFKKNKTHWSPVIPCNHTLKKDHHVPHKGFDLPPVSHGIGRIGLGTKVSLHNEMEKRLQKFKDELEFIESPSDLRPLYMKRKDVDRLNAAIREMEHVLEERGWRRQHADQQSYTR